MPDGGLRDRLIHESLLQNIKAELDLRGWFDSGRDHAPILVVDEFPDDPGEVADNTVAVSMGDGAGVETELGSTAEDHEVALFVDFFAESDGLGRHLIGDVYDFLRANPIQPVYDYTITRNLLTENQSSLETDTTGWNPRPNTAISRSVLTATDGLASLQILNNSGGPNTIGAVTDEGIAGVAVLPSVQYTATAEIAPASATRTVNIYISWYDQAGAFLSQSASTAGQTGVGVYTLLAVTASSPANAAFAAVQVEAVGTADTEVHNVDQIGIRRGNNSIWYLGGNHPQMGTVEVDSDIDKRKPDRAVNRYQKHWHVCSFTVIDYGRTHD